MATKRSPLPERRSPFILTSRHHDTAAPARSRPSANHDIHVAVRRSQKIHQAFGGKTLQLEAVS
jgi:hypothetical protein